MPSVSQPWLDTNLCLGVSQVWGPGHRGYDSNSSLSANLDRKFSADFFDVIFYESSAEGNPGAGLLELSTVSRAVTVASPGGSTHSCVPGPAGARCFERLRAHQPRIVIMSSAFDLMQCCRPPSTAGPPADPDSFSARRADSGVNAAAHVRRYEFSSTDWPDRTKQAQRPLDEQSLMVHVPAVTSAAIFDSPPSFRRPIDVLVLLPASGEPTVHRSDWLSSVASGLRGMMQHDEGMMKMETGQMMQHDEGQPPAVFF